jgi:hypothetical protein
MAQPIHHFLHFGLGSELPGIGFAQTLPNMFYLPTVGLYIGIKGLVYHVTPVSVEGRGYGLKRFARLIVNPHRHRILGHVLHRNTL